MCAEKNADSAGVGWGVPWVCLLGSVDYSVVQAFRFLHDLLPGSSARYWKQGVGVSTYY